LRVKALEIVKGRGES